MIAIYSVDKSTGLMGYSDGSLAFRDPQDMWMFKVFTWNSVVVMGRKTAESLPGPLPRRRNIVVSSNPQPGLQKLGFEVLTWDELQVELDFFSDLGVRTFCIGGPQLLVSLQRRLIGALITEFDSLTIDLEKEPVFLPESVRNHFSAAQAKLKSVWHPTEKITARLYEVGKVWSY